MDAPPDPLKGLSILVVDDCVDNQFLFRRLLMRKGADVTIAEDGQQATDQAMRGNFDLVLMDIQMPVMDGFQALEKLNALGYKKPVVALTAQSRAEERTKISAAGFSAHVTKPVEMQSLIQTIQDLVHP